MFEIDNKNLNYYTAGNVYSAQYGGMRYKIYKAENVEKESPSEEENSPKIVAVLWPCPWCIEKTDDDLKIYKEFTISEKGLEEAKEWVQMQYEQQKENWDKFDTGRLF